MVVLAISLLALLRIGNLQFVEGSKWRQMAEQIGLKYKSINATRGNIYSDNGSLLATSLPEYKLAIDPTVASDEIIKSGIDSLSLLLSRYFGDHKASYYKRIITNGRAADRQYIVLNKDLISYQDKKKISTWPIFRKGRLKGGVIFEKVNRRIRPFSYLGYRTIGFVNANNNGAGLEYSFNNYLSGTDGRALYRKIAGGKWRPINDDANIRPINGYDIETTININLQDVTENALLAALQEHDAEYGCAVVMEVETGEIKAISNLTKNKKSYDYREVYNYVVQGLNDPGSTIKLASMMALLEDSNLDVSDTIDTGDGKYKFYKQVMRDHITGGYGEISVREAFAYSSNIAISKLVENHFGSKPERFVDYLAEFGLTEPLGFQMIGEGVPKVKRPGEKGWSGVSLPWMSIGYELELTPLQVLTFYNAVANEGKMISPIIVRSVNMADQEIRSFKSRTIQKRICSEKTLRTVRSLLEDVVEYGTAKNIKDSDYKIAGKTGTAQKIVKGRYKKKYNTSFVGYFPADNPKYSCIVVIDQPRGFRQYGSSVAAPVFKEIADKIYSVDLNLHESATLAKVDNGIFPVIKSGNKDDLETICNQLGIENQATSQDEWVKTDIKNNAVLWTTNEIAPGIIPDVRGMTLRDAIFLLENQGLNVLHNGKGRVTEQSQLPGVKALSGSTIKLKLG